MLQIPVISVHAKSTLSFTSGQSQWSKDVWSKLRAADLYFLVASSASPVTEKHIMESSYRILDANQIPANIKNTNWTIYLILSFIKWLFTPSLSDSHDFQNSGVLRQLWRLVYIYMYCVLFVFLIKSYRSTNEY